ncbi:acyl-CoA N-acyltransferase [Mycena leptocephala]|nr:acyl-CoA N-acyltransferase [Mycena leptocephala]
MFLDAPLVSKSGRIALVAPTEADDAPLAALRSDPTVRRFLRFMPASVSAADMAARRTAQAADPTVIVFNIHALNRDAKPASTPSPPKFAFAGQASIYRMDRAFGSTCEAGVMISPRHFGGALATDALYTVLEYAFDALRFHRVVFHTAVDNVIIREWIAWVGGTFEGLEREGWTDGKGGYEDACLYSILDREWRGTGRERVERGGMVGAPRSRL